jgi:hypothetical protein
MIYNIDDKYIEDLKSDLRTLLDETNELISITNGDTRIVLEDAIESPDILLCKNCVYALRCLAGRRVSLRRARREKRSCYHARCWLYFYYKCILCLSYSIRTRTTTEYLGRSIYSSEIIQVVDMYSYIIKTTFHTK